MGPRAKLLTVHDWATVACSSLAFISWASQLAKSGARLLGIDSLQVPLGAGSYMSQGTGLQTAAALIPQWEQLLAFVSENAILVACSPSAWCCCSIRGQECSRRGSREQLAATRRAVELDERRNATPVLRVSRSENQPHQP